MLKLDHLKIVLAINSLLFVLAATAVESHAEAVRQRMLIDSDWRFVLGDVQGAQAVRLDDASWQRVGLPHSFGIPYFGSSKFYIGYGWYRKHILLKHIASGQRMAIEFEAAFQDAEVFVNGQRVGEHLGGYTGFSMDITKELHGGDNVIGVRLNNNWNPQLNPRAGEHNFNGGIYRNVYLVTTSDLHVDWHGTFVTTPGLAKAGGPVHIATDIRNDSERERHFLLITDILDAAGRKVSTAQSVESVPANTTTTFQQQTPLVPEPALWSPQHPNMYSAHTHVLDGKRVVDDYVTPFGFRWFRWTADQGFFLNGEHFFFHGANAHQDHAEWGDAVTNAGIKRDVRLIKEAGFTFIRGSHYPHSPVFADECDRLGVMLWSENSFWGTAGAKEGFWTASAYPPDEKDQKPFEENVRRSLAEMIRINHNHPSIVAWSMGNEDYFANRAVLPQVRTFLAELVQETHELDPTRPAAIGGVQRGQIDHIGDVAGYNGDGARLFMNSGIPNAVTEYGDFNSVRPGPSEPVWGDIKGQPEYAWRSGVVLWCAFDHGSIFLGEGTMGIVDYFRLPKAQWYWYRNTNTGVAVPEPAKPSTASQLALTTDIPGPIRADGTGDVQVIVSVEDASGKRISNTPPVKLEIVSGPGEFPTGRSIQFAPDSDIVIRDGEAAIEMRSYQSGEIHVRATLPGLKPAIITIGAEGGPPFKPGVTPVAAERPVISYGGERLQVLGQQGDVSLDRPTDSSSNIDDHTSRFANDGDQNTYWQPAPTATGDVWWQVDFEHRCDVRSVRFSLGTPAAYGYAIQSADEAGNWANFGR
jgi:hypothetical protein